MKTKTKLAMIGACLTAFMCGAASGILMTAHHFKKQKDKEVSAAIVDEICKVRKYAKPAEEEKPDTNQEPCETSYEELEDPTPYYEALKKGEEERKAKKEKTVSTDYTRYYDPGKDSKLIGDSESLAEVYKPPEKPYFVDQDLVLNDRDVDTICLTYYIADRVLTCEESIGSDIIDEVDARDMLGDCLREIENCDSDDEFYVFNAAHNRYYEIEVVNGWFENPNIPEDPHEDEPKVEKIVKRRRKLDG